eukprot:461309_1
MSTSTSTKQTEPDRQTWVCVQLLTLVIGSMLLQSNYIQNHDSYDLRMQIVLCFIGIRVSRQIFYGYKLCNNNLLQFNMTIIVGLINCVIDGIGIILTAKCSIQYVTIIDIVGILLYFIGCIMETGHDWFKYNFKQNAKNNGKLYNEKFATYLIYPNYCGFWLWHTGKSMLTNHWYFILIISVMQFMQFVKGAIPKARQYCLKKYGKKYEIYSQNTYKMIPFVY